MSDLESRKEQCLNDIEALEKQLEGIEQKIEENKEVFVGVGTRMDYENPSGKVYSCSVVGHNDYVAVVFSNYGCFEYPGISAFGWRRVIDIHSFPLRMVTKHPEKYTVVGG